METDRNLVDQHIFEEKLITLIGKNSGNNFTTVLTIEQYSNILNQVQNSMRKNEFNEKLSCQDYIAFPNEYTDIVRCTYSYKIQFANNCSKII
ncbi:hypothetical protein NQ318_009434 [Aromia moschata]|uniref:Uncharacterized protein n=1 Tax=Aromia moschata TaxID=1265417 RepID=A0AAV8ZA41_9CUCU|nr:hypothetical protein NQ318_009434 [Aromia moschata]